MLITVCLNLLSDLVFLVLLAAAGWLIYRFTKHAQLVRFFGVDVSHRITVYLSNLRVLRGGALGTDGNPYSYQGTAVAFGEMLTANRFRDLFNYFLPSLSEKPGILSKLLISDVQVQLLPSPLSKDQVERSTSFVSLGSPAYNSASRFVEEDLHSRATFTPSIPTIQIPGVPPITDLTYGFVERVVETTRKRSVFYCAGLSELGTMGAANFLAAEWSRLWDKNRFDKSFLIMLKFDPADYTSWTIIFEL